MSSATDRPHQISHFPREHTELILRTLGHHVPWASFLLLIHGNPLGCSSLEVTCRAFPGLQNGIACALHTFHSVLCIQARPQWGCELLESSRHICLCTYACWVIHCALLRTGGASKCIFCVPLNAGHMTSCHLTVVPEGCSEAHTRVTCNLFDHEPSHLNGVWIGLISAHC